MRRYQDVLMETRLKNEEVCSCCLPGATLAPTYPDHPLVRIINYSTLLSICWCNHWHTHSRLVDPRLSEPLVWYSDYLLFIVTLLGVIKMIISSAELVILSYFISFIYVCKIKPSRCACGPLQLFLHPEKLIVIEHAYSFSFLATTRTTIKQGMMKTVLLSIIENWQEKSSKKSYCNKVNIRKVCRKMARSGRRKKDGA